MWRWSHPQRWCHKLNLDSLGKSDYFLVVYSAPRGKMESDNESEKKTINEVTIKRSHKKNLFKNPFIIFFSEFFRCWSFLNNSYLIIFSVHQHTNVPPYHYCTELSHFNFHLHHSESPHQVSVRSWRCTINMVLWLYLGC